MDENYREIFASNLQQIMEKRGFSQKDLALKLGVSGTAVYHWVNGIKFPRIDILQKIAEVLDVPMTTLVHEGGASKAIADIDDADRLEALHRNPRLGMLFDKSRQMSDADIDAILHLVERILDERN